MEFTHPVLNEKMDAIGGHYMITREEMLDHPDGEILYFTGFAVTDRSCCGPGGCGYAIVAGHIISLRWGVAPDKKPCSTVVPVREECYADISRAIRLKEGVSQIFFLRENGEYKVMF